MKTKTKTPTTDLKPLQFTVVRKSTLPMFDRSRYGAAITRALQNRHEAVIIPVAGETPRRARSTFAALVSAIKGRGYAKVLKAYKRGDEIILGTIR